MGNGNVLRVVGRDARGRESINPARAARFVREHATELGVGAALLGGAILAGTLHKNWAVPTEPVNEFDLHMPRPVPAPVAPLPNVAKVEISDEPSLNPVSGYRPQSPRSEADAGAPEGDILTAKASEAGQSNLIRKGRMQYENLTLGKKQADERAEYLERQKRNEERQSFGRSRLYV